MAGWSATGAIIGFRLEGRMFRMNLPLPSREKFRYAAVNQYGTVRERSKRSIETAYEMAIRQRWRALALVVKAQLEAVDAGIATFEEAFIGAVMLPSGETVQEWVQPQVA